MLTIPIANDNRPMADCEETSRLIGFPDVLPMIGSALVKVIFLCRYIPSVNSFSCLSATVEKITI